MERVNNIKPMWLMVAGMATASFLMGLVAGIILGPLAIIIFLSTNWIFASSKEKNAGLMSFVSSSAGIIGACLSLLFMGWTPREIVPMMFIIIGYLPFGWYLAR